MVERIDVAALRALMDKATPGPLTPELGEAHNVRAAHGGIYAQVHHLKGHHGSGGRLHGDEAAANARLIAAAINALPELLRVYQAVADAPEVLANEWIWENVPEELEGQRVRLVPTSGEAA